MVVEKSLCPRRREVLKDGRARQTKGVASYLGFGFERVEDEDYERPEGEESQDHEDHIVGYLGRLASLTASEKMLKPPTPFCARR